MLRRYNRHRNKPKLALKFTPAVSIEGAAMYATCVYLSTANQTFSKKQEEQWMAVLAKTLHTTYGVNAENLTLTWEPDKSRYRVNFNNDMEFIMLKMVHT